MPTPKNIYKGAVNRRAGEAFEELIDTTCLVYKIAKIAFIEKTPEPMRPISKPTKDGRFTAVYTKQAQPDYKGTLKGGRSVVFEAKSTVESFIKQERVTKEQTAALELHHTLGAVCFVAAEIKGGFYAIPWTVWKNMKELFGRKYISKEEAKPYEVKIKLSAGTAYLDFLEGILEEGRYGT